MEPLQAWLLTYEQVAAAGLPFLLFLILGFLFLGLWYPRAHVTNLEKTIAKQEAAYQELLADRDAWRDVARRD